VMKLEKICQQANAVLYIFNVGFDFPEFDFLNADTVFLGSLSPVKHKYFSIFRAFLSQCVANSFAKMLHEIVSK